MLTHALAIESEGRNSMYVYTTHPNYRTGAIPEIRKISYEHELKR